MLLCSYSVKSFAIVVFAVVLMYLLWCSDAFVRMLVWCCGAVLMSLYRNTFWVGVPFLWCSSMLGRADRFA